MMGAARCAFGALMERRCPNVGTALTMPGPISWCAEHNPPTLQPDARDEIGCECPHTDSMDCLRASDERVDALGDHYEGEGCGCDCHFVNEQRLNRAAASGDGPAGGGR